MCIRRRYEAQSRHGSAFRRRRHHGGEAGDEGAWRELYSALGGRLVGWLRSQSTLDSAMDADDIANEAWLTAARRIAEFTGSIDDFAGWIFVIARNLLVNIGRRSVRRATNPTSLDPRELVDDLPSDDEGAQVDAQDWIRRTARPAEPRERDVVACIDIAGLDVSGDQRGPGDRSLCGQGGASSCDEAPQRTDSIEGPTGRRRATKP